MFNDYYFWFSQPSTILNSFDLVLGYVFAGLVVLSVIAWLLKKFYFSHPVVRKLVGRFGNAMLWTGLIGLVWFGFRYEAVPIFSRRMWAALIVLSGVIWIGFIKWYMFSKFRKEKQDFDYASVKSKYIPGKR